MPASSPSWPRRGSTFGDRVDLDASSWQLAARFGYEPSGNGSSQGIDLPKAPPATEVSANGGYAVPDAPATLAAGGRGDVGPPLVPLPAGTRPVVSFAQQRLWFVDQLYPGTVSYNAVRLWRLPADVDPDILAAACSAVAARHDVLRSRFPAVGGQPVVVYEAPVPVPLARVTVADSAAAASVIADQRGLSFDLATGPLIRTTLLEYPDGSRELLVVMHHIVTDGWSWGIFASEVAVCYDAFGGRAGPCPRPAARELRRLCRLAAFLAHRGEPRDRGGVVAAVPGRRPACPRAAERSSPAAGALLRRQHGRRRPRRGASRAPARRRPR